MVANIDDPYGLTFLEADIEKKVPYSLEDPELHTLTKDGVSVVLEGITIRTPLVGLFNIYNVLAAISCAQSFGVPLKIIERALGDLPPIKGRVEKIITPEGAAKHVTAVVDYAHTPDSLEKLYQSFGDTPKICVLGNTGGGQDLRACTHLDVNHKQVEHAARIFEETFAKGLGSSKEQVATGEPVVR